MRRCDCKALIGTVEPVAFPGALVRLCTLAVVLIFWFGVGCSGPVLSFRAEESEVSVEPASTGSIARPPTSFGKDLTDEDWRRAHAALSVALDPQGNGRPVKWDNPETGMHGSVDPAGLPYVAQDEICRDFRATVSGAGTTRSMRGTGCRASGGIFELKRLRTAKG